ncbi:MAG: hypothetical protein WKG32_17725 [Gemmatimonadaceae bacterium]
MRTLYTLGVAALIAGCASAGGGSIFPEAGDPNAALTNAERQIAEAQAAGADSLVADVMASARQNLANAKAQAQGTTRGRAALAARQAAADAIYAREQVKRIMAERTQAQAKSAFDALPPGGAQ